MYLDVKKVDETELYFNFYGQKSGNDYWCTFVVAMKWSRFTPHFAGVRIFTPKFENFTQKKSVQQVTMEQQS